MSPRASPWETRLCRESKLRQRFGDRHGHEPPVVATVVVGNGQTAVCIGPPPTCVPFLAFSAKLEINLERKPNKDRFELLSSFTLGSASNGINPVTDAVTLEAGTFTTTIPAGSFKEIGLGIFVFHGVIGGVRLEALIAPTGSLRYALVAAAQDANLTGTKNPVPVSLTIGDDCGTAGLGECEIAARVGLYGTDASVLSFQAGLRSPGGSFADSLGPFACAALRPSMSGAWPGAISSSRRWWVSSRRRLAIAFTPPVSRANGGSIRDFS
jgi:hypothetical protein